MLTALPRLIAGPSTTKPDHVTTPGGARPAAAEVALRTMYAQHGPVLLAYAEGFTGDRGLAEDIVQETFLRAWRHLDRLLADPRPVRVWLLHVTRNLLTDAARAASVRPAPATAEIAVQAAEYSADGGLSRLLDQAVLADAMERLSPAHREVLIETFYGDVPPTVTADRLGVPVGTVRSRLHYALRELRALLTPDDVLVA